MLLEAIRLYMGGGLNKTSQEMPRKIGVTVPDVVYHQIEKWAEQQGRPLSGLAAKLLEERVEQLLGQSLVVRETTSPPEKQ